jgi:hypothetical protein
MLGPHCAKEQAKRRRGSRVTHDEILLTLPSAKLLLLCSFLNTVAR